MSVPAEQLCKNGAAHAEDCTNGKAHLRDFFVERPLFRLNAIQPLLKIIKRDGFRVPTRHIVKFFIGVFALTHGGSLSPAHPILKEVVVLLREAVALAMLFAFFTAAAVWLHQMMEVMG